MSNEGQHQIDQGLVIRLEQLIFEIRNQFAHLYGTTETIKQQTETVCLEARNSHAHSHAMLTAILENVRSGVATTTSVTGNGSSEDRTEMYTLGHRMPLPGGDIPVEVLCAAIRAFAHTLADSDKFLLAERLSHAAYPAYKFSEFGREWLADQQFFADYRKLMDKANWHSADRKYFVKEIARGSFGLTGDFAECGVYTGGTALILCRQAEAQARHVHLFDSFEGLSTPSADDGDYWKPGALACSLEQVRTNLSPFTNYTCYKGWIPSRFDAVADRLFALVHIDVDLHDPTRDALDFFYPRLVSGGAIILDDHGFSSCPGARRAALDFCRDKSESVIDLPTGQGLIVRRAP